jgi:hypothetical protein
MHFLDAGGLQPISLILEWKSRATAVTRKTEPWGTTGSCGSRKLDL